VSRKEKASLPGPPKEFDLDPPLFFDADTLGISLPICGSLSLSSSRLGANRWKRDAPLIVGVFVDRYLSALPWLVTDKYLPGSR